jgi:hypothetical protein
MATPEDTPLGDREVAELAALADGSLPAERRADLERRVAESAQLRAALDEQIRAVEAVRQAAVPAPAGLRARVQSQRERRRRFPLSVPVAVGVGAGAATTALALVLALPGGGPGRPTVAAAAGLALRAPEARLPEAPRTTTLPGVRLDSVSYPNWYRRYGWEAVGIRSDRLNGRHAKTVFYTKHGRQIGYTVVAGERLRVPRDAATAVQKGVTLRTFSLGGRPVVTWERKGHTCVLTGAAAPRDLAELAAWNAKGAIEF